MIQIRLLFHLKTFFYTGNKDESEEDKCNSQIDFKNKMIKSFEQCQLWPLNLDDYKVNFENAQKKIDQIKNANNSENVSLAEEADEDDEEVEEEDDNDEADDDDDEEDENYDEKGHVDENDDIENKPPDQNESDSDEFQPKKKRARLSQTNTRRRSLPTSAVKKTSHAKTTPVVKAPANSKLTPQSSKIKQDKDTEAALMLAPPPPAEITVSAPLSLPTVLIVDIGDLTPSKMKIATTKSPETPVQTKKQLKTRPDTPTISTSTTPFRRESIKLNRSSLSRKALAKEAIHKCEDINSQVSDHISKIEGDESKMDISQVVADVIEVKESNKDVLSVDIANVKTFEEHSPPSQRGVLSNISSNSQESKDQASKEKDKFEQNMLCQDLFKLLTKDKSADGESIFANIYTSFSKKRKDPSSMTPSDHEIIKKFCSLYGDFFVEEQK